MSQADLKAREEELAHRAKLTRMEESKKLPAVEPIKDVQNVTSPVTRKPKKG